MADAKETKETELTQAQIKAKEANARLAKFDKVEFISNGKAHKKGLGLGPDGTLNIVSRDQAEIFIKAGYGEIGKDVIEKRRK